MVNLKFSIVPDIDMQTPKKPSSTAKAQAKNSAWQAEKSELTQSLILNATVRSLVKVGYAQTLTATIAKEAGISRGALMHHYKSRAEIFHAVAEFIVAQRAAEFERLVPRIHHSSAGLPILDSFKETMALLLTFYSSILFQAHYELVRGARGDADLKRALKTLEKALGRSEVESLSKHMPYWDDMPEARDKLANLVHATLQGMVLNAMHYTDKVRAQVAEHLAEIAYQEFTKAYAARHGKTKPAKLAKL